MKTQKIGYLLILPAFIFILIFSLYPIARSGLYSLFDYQLNDPAKARLSLTVQYDLSAFEETSRYLDYYLGTELETAALETSRAGIQNLLQAVDGQRQALTAQYGALRDHTPVTLSQQEADRLQAFGQSVGEGLEALYGTGDQGLLLGEDVKAVATGYATALQPPNFVGLRNYSDALRDPRLWGGLRQTVLFTVASVAFELVLGILLALVMNRAMKGRELVRVFSLIPWAIPTAVSALIWMYLYNGSSGIVAHLFAAAGLVRTPADLLLSGPSAMAAVILADVWKTTPYMALMILAGLQTIPASYYEAAAIDGATRVQQFFVITLPMLKSSILVALLFRTLDAFRVFDLIWVLTGGGPGGSTESISIYAYKTMFAQTQFGYGSAVAILLALCVGVISFIYIRILDVDLVAKED